jgi:hypothetical protein
MRNFPCWIIPVLLLLVACNRTGPSSGSTEFIPDPASASAAEEALTVIYSLSLPTDIIAIFEETGSGFSPAFTIPLDLISLYEDQGQMALLLGALGVDLSYCKLFERTTESGDIYKNMELLAYNLDLPREIFEKSSEELEWYVHKPDSLTGLIDEIYGEVDAYFREQNQESLASLTLLGGWLEAMYIGVRIYQDKSVLDMGDRIMQQKYTLNSLAGLLSNYQESLEIRSYIHLLSNLKDAYDSVEIKVSGEDTITNIRYEAGTLDEVCRLIIQMREGVIT